MITPEAWTPVIINSQCSSIKWIERSTKYVLPRIQVVWRYFLMYFGHAQCEPFFFLVDTYVRKEPIGMAVVGCGG